MKTILRKHTCRLASLVFLALLPLNALCQQPLAIPPTISGDEINLTIKNSSREFYQGFSTSTIGYNGSYLGPTIILKKGQRVTLNVTNQIGDTTTTHWHGLNVAPENDGSPHVMIMDKEIWSPSFTVMDKAATYWYHPHMHGKTLKQVVKGAAGLIIVQDEEESKLDLPRSYGVDDVPLIMQFQTIDANSKQILLDDEKDNAVLVNGGVWPVTTNMPAQVVRFRILNASSHRFFQYGFSDSRDFYQITSDAGLLNNPVKMKRLQLGSGERAEILVDLSGENGKNIVLRQFGTELPSGYPGGPAGMGMRSSTQGPLDNTNFDLLRITIKPPTTNPVVAIPSALTTNSPWSQVGASKRTIAITASPMMSMTNFLLNGTQFKSSVINFKTKQEDVEIWTITNASMMPHPFHVHGNHFYVLDVNGQAPPENMRGRKDVVTVPPMNGSVRFITKYENFSSATMPYMFHCHILSHEDGGMMGQFLVEGGSTGVWESNSERSAVRIYPNPVNDAHPLTVQAESSLNSVELVDVLGRTVFHGEALSSRIEIDTSPFNGVYVLRVRLGDTVIMKKVVVNR